MGLRTPLMSFACVCVAGGRTAQVCLSPSEYREHLALGKEIESAKDKLKEVEHEYVSRPRSILAERTRCDTRHELGRLVATGVQ